MSDNEVPARVTNEQLRSDISTMSRQFSALQTLNNEQSNKLAKLEDVPAKLDKLLELNISLAGMTQIQNSHATKLGELSASTNDLYTKVNAIDRKVAARIGYASGALALTVVIAGLLSWLGQQAISGAFAEISSVHSAITGLQVDVNVLKFQAGGPVVRQNPKQPKE